MTALSSMPARLLHQVACHLGRIRLEELSATRRVWKRDQSGAQRAISGVRMVVRETFACVKLFAALQVCDQGSFAIYRDTEKVPSLFATQILSFVCLLACTDRGP